MQMRSGKYLAVMVRDFKTYSCYLQSLVFHNLILGIRKEEDNEGTMPPISIPKSADDEFRTQAALYSLFIMVVAVVLVCVIYYL